MMARRTQMVIFTWVRRYLRFAARIEVDNFPRARPQQDFEGYYQPVSCIIGSSRSVSPEL